MIVKPGVDEELDATKHQYNGLGSLLSGVVKRVAEDMPGGITGLNVIYFPQLGFLVLVPRDPVSGKGVYEGPIDDENKWDYMFNTAESVFYKSGMMRRLDEEFGDIFGLICGISLSIHLCFRS